jgi:hypothetical protein
MSQIFHFLVYCRSVWECCWLGYQKILPINTLLFETTDVYLFDFWFFRFIIIITLICSVLKLTFVFLVFPSLGIRSTCFVFSLVHRTTQADVGIHQWHRFPLLFVSYPGGGQALSKYAHVVGTPL